MAAPKAVSVTAGWSRVLLQHRGADARPDRRARPAAGDKDALAYLQPNRLQGVIRQPLHQRQPLQPGRIALDR